MRVIADPSIPVSIYEPSTTARVGGSLLRDIHPIVIGIAIDELVVGIDARPGGRLVDNNLEGLVGLGEPYLLEIQGFFFVLLASEYADVDEVMQRHGGLVAAAVGLDFSGLDTEGDFVFVVGGRHDGGGKRFVVVENDVLESVSDEVLKIRGSLRAQSFDELAGVGVRGRLGVVGVR